MSRSHSIGSRGILLNIDPRVHDAPFMGSFEDELSIVLLGLVFAFTLDAGACVDVLAQFCLEELFNGRT